MQVTGHSSIFREWHIRCFVVPGGPVGGSGPRRHRAFVHTSATAFLLNNDDINLADQRQS